MNALLVVIVGLTVGCLLAFALGMTVLSLGSMFKSSKEEDEEE